MISRLAGALTLWSQRWVPDAYIIAVILTAIVFVLAIVVGGATPLKLSTLGEAAFGSFFPSRCRCV